MNRFSAFLLLAASLALALNGCCARRASPKNACPPYFSQTLPLAVAEKLPGAGVTADFDAIPKSTELSRSLFESLASGSMKIDLLETVCAAARNSAKAELIEAERHAVQCQSSNRPSHAIDLILQGESLEQRNKSAGSAAEVFLGLVQVQLQRDLLDASKTHLDELAATIQGASDAKFSTAEGKNELAQGRIRLKESESELNSAEQRLQYQLNLLINPDSVNPDSANFLTFAPIHELTLTNQQLDIRQQTEIAATHRPGIQSLQTAISQNPESDTLYSLLGQFDSGLGIHLSSGPITKRLLRRKLIEKLSQDESPDGTAETRHRQVQQVMEFKKQEARIQATNALLQLQRSLEKLSILNEDLARLEDRHQQLKSKQKIDAQNSYLDLNRNWVDQQQVKSDRIAAAIEYETAKIKLLEAQGHLITQCGYVLTSSDNYGAHCRCD
jgi:hypothetical protein